MEIDRNVLINALTGDDDAQFQLSLHYYKNEKAEKESIFWLNRAIKKGNLKAFDLLQEINTKNYLIRCNYFNKNQSI